MCSFDGPWKHLSSQRSFHREVSHLRCLCWSCKFRVSLYCLSGQCHERSFRYAGSYGCQGNVITTPYTPPSPPTHHPTLPFSLMITSIHSPTLLIYLTPPRNTCSDWFMFHGPSMQYFRTNHMSSVQATSNPINNNPNSIVTQRYDNITTYHEQFFWYSQYPPQPLSSLRRKR